VIEATSKKGDCATFPDRLDSRSQVGSAVGGAFVVGGCARLLRQPADNHALPITLADLYTAQPSTLDPIPLPRGRQLVTLQDAVTYITKLPKAEHEAAQLERTRRAASRFGEPCAGGIVAERR
jgi:hypothetical protein